MKLAEELREFAGMFRMKYFWEQFGFNAVFISGTVNYFVLCFM